MISGSALEHLSTNLSRLSAGDADGEIVRWLRTMLPQAAGIAAPAQPVSGHGYARSLIYKNDAFEVLIIHWKPNCVTPIHDHGGAQCWFAVADGLMHVDNFVRRDGGAQTEHAQFTLEGREDLALGGIDYRNDDAHLHRCLTGPAAATTLHVYARPIERFNAFDEQTGLRSTLVSAYDYIP